MFFAESIHAFFLFVQVRTDIVTRMSGLVVTYVLMCSA